MLWYGNDEQGVLGQEPSIPAIKRAMNSPVKIDALEESECGEWPSWCESRWVWDLSSDGQSSVCYWVAQDDNSRYWFAHADVQLVHDLCGWMVVEQDMEEMQ